MFEGFGATPQSEKKTRKQSPTGNNNGTQECQQTEVQRSTEVPNGYKHGFQIPNMSAQVLQWRFKDTHDAKKIPQATQSDTHALGSTPGYKIIRTKTPQPGARRRRCRSATPCQEVAGRAGLVILMASKLGGEASTPSAGSASAAGDQLGLP